jgi:hypothetical protein
VRPDRPLDAGDPGDAGDAGGRCETTWDRTLPTVLRYGMAPMRQGQRLTRRSALKAFLSRELPRSGQRGWRLFVIGGGEGWLLTLVAEVGEDGVAEPWPKLRWEEHDGSGNDLQHRHHRGGHRPRSLSRDS